MLTFPHYSTNLFLNVHRKVETSSPDFIELAGKVRIEHKVQGTYN